MMIEDWTEEEKRAVAKFRKRMTNDVPAHMHEDKFLFYKFLKARNFNLHQAEAMLKKHLIWRKEIQIDMILTDFKPSEVLQKYISQSFVGFSKQGYLVQYGAIGNTDGRGILKSSNNFDGLRCIMQEIERNIRRLKHHSEKIGRPVNQCIYIYDMDNMTLAKATHKKTVELFAIGVSVFQDNYPELLKNLYIINASIYFTLAFPVVKSILSGALLEKIKVFGKDGWKEELLRVIDADVLPAFLGGTRTDPDGNPFCPSSINRVGVIPEKYYLVKNIEVIAQKPGCKILLIDRHSTANVMVNVKQKGLILNWEFEMKYHDIGFGLLLEGKGKGTNTTELIPVHKVLTENKSETGKYRCENAGTYIVIFDNTYSWFHTKEVYYRTWVTDCKDEMSKKDISIMAMDI